MLAIYVLAVVLANVPVGQARALPALNETTSTGTGTAATTPGHGHPSAIFPIAIHDSGSTNTPRLDILIQMNNHAQITATATSRVGQLGTSTSRRGIIHQSMPVSITLVSKLVNAIHASGNLSQIPSGHCMKSVSFGVSITLTSHGQKTPDLTCLGPLATSSQRQLATLTQQVITQAFAMLYHVTPK